VPADLDGEQVESREPDRHGIDIEITESVPMGEFDGTIGGPEQHDTGVDHNLKLCCD